MFCDLVDSSLLAGELDPEDWSDIVSAYHETCEEAVRRFDSYVAEKLGDGVVAYFGWPAAHEDDAYRAVRTALSVIEAMQGLNARLERDRDIRLQVRIGIDTGTVVVGIVGGDPMEGRATGNALVLASRLQGIAGPDTVVISGTTANLVRDRFAVEPLGLQSLKNVSNAVEAYRVIEELRVDDRLEAVGNRGLTPLTARESELEVLLDLWDRAAAGQSQVAWISGEPGIGKSRLVKVLRQSIGNNLEFRCSPYDSHSALFPVLRRLERLLGFEQLEKAGDRLERLADKLEDLGFSVPDVVPLLASQFSLPLTGVVGSNLSAGAKRQQTFDVLVDWLVREAERRPLMTVWEDLHWADPSTIELLDLVIDRAANTGVPLLTVMTFRSGEFQPPSTALAGATEVTLGRLERQDVEKMIERITDGRSLPQEVVDQIVEKTDGVPLFVEELVQTIIDSGFIRDEGDHFVIARPLTEMAIPATLEDSLMSRLDRLGAAKVIAQRGAILGRAFSQDLMRAVLDTDARNAPERAEGWRRAEECLAQLVDAGVLFQRRTAQTTYEFKHALIRDAAYQSLLKRTRQAYHLQTARVLETQFAHVTETQPELVARHFTEAFQLDRALEYWQRAGERARDRSANKEALHHFSEGLTILAALPHGEDRDRRELALRIASLTPLIAVRGYNTDETASTVNRALGLGRALGEVARLFPVLYGLWVNRLVGAQYGDALQLSEAFLREARKNEDAGPRLMGHRLCGVSLFSVGRLADADSHLQDALLLYDPHRHGELKNQGYAQDPRGACEAFMAMVKWLRGYPELAAVWSRTALEHAKEARHSNTWGYVLCFGGVMPAVFRRDAASAERLGSELIRFSTEEKLPVWLAYARILHGWALSRTRLIEDGITEMTAGLADFEDTSTAASTSLHMGFMKSFLLSLLAEAYLTAGRPEEGLARLDTAWSFAEATGEGFWKAELPRLRGELLLGGGSGSWDSRCEEADACFHRALDVAADQGTKALELRAVMSLSALWSGEGPSEARERLRQVYDSFTEGFDSGDLLEARRLLDETAGQPRTVRPHTPDASREGSVDSRR